MKKKMAAGKIYLFLILFLLAGPILQAQQRYQVGKILYGKDGQKEGVIFWINPERTGGWAVALENLPNPCPWAPHGAVPGLTDYPNGLEGMVDTAGYTNTEKIYAFTGEGEDYAFQLVKKYYGSEWYIPSLGQMRRLMALSEIIDPILVENGGQAMRADNFSSMCDYWCSSAQNEEYAFKLDFYYRRIQTGNRNNDCLVRPIRNFKIEEINLNYTYQWNTGSSDPVLSTLPQPGKNDYTVTVTSRRGACSGQATQSVLVASSGALNYKDTICKGQTYNKNGFNTATPGLHRTALNLEAGCFIPVNLTLTVADTFHTPLSDSFCKGSIYQKNNFTAYYPGTYTQRLRTLQGCDSVVTLNLTENISFDTTYYESVCAGETYEGHGFVLPDVVRDTFCFRNPGTPAGCDSLLKLVLTIRPAAELQLYDSVCIGSAYQGYEHFTLPVVERDTVCRYLTRSTFGCDSVVYLHLKALPFPDKWIEDSICPGEIYTKYGLQTSAGGEYEVKIPATEGCDTTGHLQLKVLSLPEKWIKDSICPGEIYTKYGLQTSVGGEYEVKIPATEGCDTTGHLQLKVVLPPEKWIDASICEGEVYTQYGLQLTMAGDYEVKIPATEGCDTSGHLHLSVYPVENTFLQDSVCAGDKYVNAPLFSLPPITKDTLCEVKLRTVRGCDSLVTLSLQRLPLKEKTVTAAIFEGENYTDYGLNVGKTGTYTVKWPATTGCDTMVRIDLLVIPGYHKHIDAGICEGEHYTEYGLDRTTSGMDTIKISGKGTAPDTTLYINLTVHPVYYILKKDSICRGETYTFCGSIYREAGDYPHYFTSRYGCDSTMRLQLFVGDYFNGSIVSDLEDCTLHEYRFYSEDHSPVPVQAVFYRWDFGDGNFSDQASPVHAYADSGRYTVRLEAITPAHCSKIQEYVQQVPWFTHAPNIYTDRNEVDADLPKVKFWTDSPGNMNYKWDFGDGTTDESNSSAVSHRYSVTNENFFDVRLWVTNSEDCEMENTVRIRAYPSLIIPNTFTPNGDGMNDLFVPGYPVKIINRNGVKIFEGTEGWDGKYKGKEVPEDTYFYELRYMTAQGEKLLSGFITVVR